MLLENFTASFTQHSTHCSTKSWSNWLRLQESPIQ